MDMITEIKSILIPTDFSESSESSLSSGIGIARRQNADVILLHVLEGLTYFQPSDVLLTEITLPPDLKTIMEERLSELAENLSKKAGIKVTGRVLYGQPYEQICKVAYEEQISLIVIGSHGTSGIRKFFMGSDAYRIVKHSTKPVLAIPGKWDKPDFKKVLFPIRLIPGSLEKYFYSRPIIEKNDSELFLLGLADKKDPVSENEISVLTESLKERLSNDNVKFQTIICQNEDFPGEVTKRAEEIGTDLIILTANLDHGWKSFLIGPFVQQVMNHSQVPVLSIKPSDSKPDEAPSINIGENWGRTLNLSSEKEEPLK